MSDKTAKQKAADVKAAKEAKAARALKLKKQVADLTTFKKSDSAIWASSAIKTGKQKERGIGIVGLKGLGQTTKIKRSGTYKAKKTT